VYPINPALHLKLAGAFLLLLAGSHVFFPRRFRWPEELARLSLLNRQIFLVHNFFIVLVVAMMGGLALCFTPALLEHSTLARLVLAGLALFWAIRLGFQFFVYDRALWRGNRFNTTVHALFSALWCYLAGTFGYALWWQMRG
jgi:hypothetical protein